MRNSGIVAAVSTTLLLAIGGSVQAGEAEVKAALNKVVVDPAKIGVIRKIDALGLYEAQVGKSIFYLDEKGKYLFLGEIVEIEGERNLTDARKDELSRVSFSDLPLHRAIKTVKGDGSRVFATFEDPECSYCRKLAKEISGLTNYTLYTFLVPTLTEKSEATAKAIWCSPDRAAAWANWMLSHQVTATKPCDANFDDLVALGARYRLSGVPTIVFPDGSRLNGYVPAATLDKSLTKGTAVASKQS